MWEFYFSYPLPYTNSSSLIHSYAEHLKETTVAKKTRTKTPPSPFIRVEPLNKRELTVIKKSLMKKDEKESARIKKVGECTACYGEVVKETIQIFPRTDFIGHQASYPETTYHCNMCGLMYKYPPKKGTIRRQAVQNPIYRHDIED